MVLWLRQCSFGGHSNSDFTSYGTGPNASERWLDSCFDDAFTLLHFYAWKTFSRVEWQFKFEKMFLMTIAQRSPFGFFTSSFRWWDFTKLSSSLCCVCHKMAPKQSKEVPSKMAIRQRLLQKQSLSQHHLSLRLCRMSKFYNLRLLRTLTHRLLVLPITTFKTSSRNDGEDGDFLQPELEGGKDPYPICCMRLEYLLIIDPIDFCFSHSWIGKYIPIPWIKLGYETWGCFTT